MDGLAMPEHTPDKEPTFDEVMNKLADIAMVVGIPVGLIGLFLMLIGGAFD